MLVFIPSVGEFVIPSLLGGPENIMIGRVVVGRDVHQQQLAPGERLGGCHDRLPLWCPWPFITATPAKPLKPSIEVESCEAWFENALRQGLVGLGVRLPLHATFVHGGFLVSTAPVKDANFTGFSFRWYEALMQRHQNRGRLLAVSSGGLGYRRAVCRAGYLCGLCAGALPALPRAYCVFRHGERALGDARRW